MKKVTKIIIAASLALSLGSMATAAEVTPSNHQSNAINGMKFTVGGGIGGGFNTEKVPEGVRFSGAGANAKLSLGTALFTTTPNSTLGLRASVGVGAYSMQQAFVPQYFVNLDFVQAFDVGDGFIKIGYIVGAGLAIRTNDNVAATTQSSGALQGSVIGAASLTDLVNTLPSLQNALNQARQNQQNAQNAFNSAQNNVTNIQSQIDALNRNAPRRDLWNSSCATSIGGCYAGFSQLDRIDKQIKDLNLPGAQDAKNRAQNALNQANQALNQAQAAFNGNRNAQVSQATSDINNIANQINSLVGQASSALSLNNLAQASSNLAQAVRAVNNANDPRNIGQSLVNQGVGDRNAFNQSLTNLQNAQTSLANISQRIVDAQNRPTPPASGNTGTAGTSIGGNNLNGLGGLSGFGNNATNSDISPLDLATLIAYLNSRNNRRIEAASTTKPSFIPSTASVLPTIKFGLIAFIGQNQSVSLEYQYYFRNSTNALASSDITLNYTYYFGGNN
ncbi:hypothetical protein [Helicobacter sp. 11S02629-2]|uniref:hypothetical protein n=1 Tax=Helicobacter sp. 11S02629-2 TaxID=1476195 RepID=UPI000BA77D69|nr:hypothetical protein [Helicobacter sp. 11S02629-2]PAF45782.1 hypothetical protein BKH40_02600 [Helicobacter sp. 11S02629-2]